MLIKSEKLVIELLHLKKCKIVNYNVSAISLSESAITLSM